MATFGDTVQGSSNTNDDLDRIRAMKATPSSSGTVTSMTCWLKVSSGSTTINAKTALYKVSDNSLVGYGTERSCDLTTSFQQFDFTCNIAIVGGTEYYLTLFKDYTATTTQTAADDVVDSSDYYQNVAYGDFPSTCSFSTYTTRVTIYATYTETPLFPYIQQTSDVDSAADIGTHSAFANQQAAADSTYDTLTEADTDTGTSTVGDTSGSGTSYRTVAADEFRGAVVTIDSGKSGEVQNVHFYGRGGSTVNVKAVITDSSGVIVTNGVGDVVSVNTTAGDKTLTFTTKPKLSAGTYWIGLIPAANLRLYYDSTTGGTMKRDTSNSYSTPTNPSDASDTTETWRILYANITELNYKLQLEEQFTSVPYDSYSRWTLHVTAGAFSSPAETLNVQAWDGDSWEALGAVTASTDNAYNVTSYTTSANLYIRFVDGTATDDVTQSTWQIDSVYLVGGNTKTFTVNVELKKNLTKAFTLNTELLKSLTKTFTLNSELQAGSATYTKTFSVGAELLKNLTKSFSLNTELLKTSSKAFTFNAELLKSYTKTFTLNTDLQKSLTKNFTLNTELLKSLTKTFTLNTELLKSASKTFTLNADLLSTSTKTFTLNTELLKSLTKTFTLNTELSAGAVASFTLNAELSKVLVKLFSLNAELESGFTAGDSSTYYYNKRKRVTEAKKRERKQLIRKIKMLLEAIVNTGA